MFFQMEGIFFKIKSSRMEFFRNKNSVPLEAFILKNRGRGKDFFICPEALGTVTRAETIDKGRRFSFISNKKWWGEDFFTTTF